MCNLWQHGEKTQVAGNQIDMMHQLQSTTLEVGVKSQGAELCSMKGVASGVEYLWQADPAEWGRHAPILFPIVGKLKNDSFLYKGQAYNLPQHGFARDQAFKIMTADSSCLMLELNSNPALKSIYPFDFTLNVKYELIESRLTITYLVKNTGKDQLLYSVGAHPAFRLPIHSGAKRSDYEIIFNENEHAAVHLIEAGLLSGKTEPLALQNKRLKISDDLFDKDALVFKHLSSKKLSLARIGETPFLNFHFDAPYFGIWSKSRKAEFVCLEPWQGIADSSDHSQELTEKEGIILLAPGGSEAFSFTIEILD